MEEVAVRDPPLNVESEGVKLSYLEYMKFSFPVSVNTMIDDISTTTALIILGIKGDLQTQSIIGFGLTYIVFIYGYSPSSMDLIGLLISSLCDQKRYRESTVIVAKVMLCMLFYIGFSIITGYFSKEIMIFIGINEELATKTSSFVKLMVIAKSIEVWVFIKKGILVAHQITDVFWFINVMAFFNMLFFSYFFMFYYNYKEIGYFLTFLIKTGTEIFLVGYLLYTRCNKECFFLPPLKDVLDQIGSMFSYSISILVGAYGEWLSVEINSYLAALMRKATYIVPWACTTNICSMNYLFGFGEVSYFRTFGAIAIGVGDKKTFMSIYRKCFIYGICNHLTISAFIFIFAGQVTSIFTSDPEAFIIMRNLLRITAFFFTLDWFSIFNSAGLRLIRLEVIQFRTMTFLYSFLIFTLSLFFAIHLKLMVNGLMISLICSNIIVNIIMFTVFQKNVDKFFQTLKISI